MADTRSPLERCLPILVVGGMACLGALTPRPAAADTIEAILECDGGLKLHVTFDNDKDIAVVESDGMEPVTLPIAMSGSGYYYTNGKYGLRGQGEEAQWEVGRMAPINCRAVG